MPLWWTKSIGVFFVLWFNRLDSLDRYARKSETFLFWRFCACTVCLWGTRIHWIQANRQLISLSMCLQASPLTVHSSFIKCQEMELDCLSVSSLLILMLFLLPHLKKTTKTPDCMMDRYKASKPNHYQCTQRRVGQCSIFRPFSSGTRCAISLASLRHIMGRWVSQFLDSCQGHVR